MSFDRQLLCLISGIMLAVRQRPHVSVDRRRAPTGSLELGSGQSGNMAGGGRRFMQYFGDNNRTFRGSAGGSSPATFPSAQTPNPLTSAIGQQPTLRWVM